MRETTLFEVMAEVGRQSEEIGSMRDAPNVGAEARATLARCNISTALDSLDPATRRDRLLRAAAWAILALHAHDAEAAKVDDRPLHSRALGGPISADDAAIAKKARIPCVRTPWMLEHVTCPTCGAPPGKSCAHAESEAK